MSFPPFTITIEGNEKKVALKGKLILFYVVDGCFREKTVDFGRR